MIWYLAKACNFKDCVSNEFQQFELSLGSIYETWAIPAFASRRVYVFIPSGGAIWWIGPLRLIVSTSTIISTILLYFNMERTIVSA